MRNFVILCLLFLINLSIFGYSYRQLANFTTEEIAFYNCEVYEENNEYIALCSSIGLFIKTPDGWLPNISSITPKQALFADASSILCLVEGDNSGIYLITISQEIIIEHVHHINEPNFLYYHENTGYIYCGTESGLYRSSDYYSWNYIEELADLPYTGASCFGDTLVVVGNSQLTWTIYNDQYESFNNMAMRYSNLINNNGIIYGILNIGMDSDGIWALDSPGNYWNVLFWMPYISSAVFDPSGSLIYSRKDCNSAAGGIFMYDEETYETTAFCNGLPNTNVNSITYYSGDTEEGIICCTDAGAYLLQDYQPVNYKKAIIRVYTPKFANHPNPFNPSTTIGFELAGEDEVTLSIYNIKGQLVNTLISREKRCAGSHSVVWDGKSSTGESVSSGMYFYRLVTGSNELINKMILIK